MEAKPVLDSAFVGGHRRFPPASGVSALIIAIRRQFGIRSLPNLARGKCDVGERGEALMYRNRLLSYLVWRYFLRQPKLRRLITKILISNGDEWIQLLGARLYVNRRNEIGYWRASRQQHGNVVLRDEMPTLTRILPLIAYASTFVDCGANVGFFTSTTLPLKRTFPQLIFYAFEPNPETFTRLEKTVGGMEVRVESGSATGLG